MASPLPVGLDEVVRSFAALEDFTDAPAETINYIECHDNHTLWDRLLISTIDDAQVTAEDRRAMAKLAAVVLLTAQGIPFIHAGQEFLRSKGGDHNSYNQPDAVNMIRWAQKAENHDVFEYYRGLIALRRAHPILRMATAEAVRAGVKFLDDDLGLPVAEGCLAVQFTDTTGTDEWARALLLVNPQRRVVDFVIPAGEWLMAVDGMRCYSRPQSYRISDTNTANVGWYSALLLVESRKQ